MLAAVALADARSCGFTPADGKGEGEPCNRSAECNAGLECLAGVCSGAFDSGPPDTFDAGTPEDASARDAALDADAPDAMLDAALDADTSGGAPDASVDASTADGGG